jgi:hypothetical protein
MNNTVPYTVPMNKTDAASILALPRPNAWYPRRESNPGTRFRKPLLYPLSYEGTSSAATVPALWAEQLFGLDNRLGDILHLRTFIARALA